MNRRTQNPFLRVGTLLVLCGLGFPFACDALDGRDDPASGGTGGVGPGFSTDGGRTPMDGKGRNPSIGGQDGANTMSPADGSPAVAVDGGAFQHGDGADGAFFMDAGPSDDPDEDAGDEDAGY
jgi:hypothetical protein